MSFLFGVLVGFIGVLVFLLVKNVVTAKELADSVDGNDQSGGV